MTNATHSLYGAGHQHATRTRECVAMPGKREQTILSPRFIPQRLRSVWGQIVCDPCAAPKGRIRVECDKCKKAGGKISRNNTWKICNHCGGNGAVYCRDTVKATHAFRLPTDGLVQDLFDRTYMNPPFGELEPWLHHPGTAGRTAWLVPVRCHRKWWRSWARTLDVLIALDPFPFEGRTQAFPSPCALGYRGDDADEIVEAFAGVGEPF